MFQEYRFGRIKYIDKVYSYDIVVHTDNKVDKRDKIPSKRKYGTSHILSTDEVQNLLDEDLEVLVVGRGQLGMLSVEDDVRHLISAQNVDLVDLPTQKAIDKFNGLKKKGINVAAIIHITC